MDAKARDSVMRKCRESIAVKEQFFAEHAERIAELCERMADRFRAGSRLWVMGNGGSACDAQHVTVEFLHPIIEKRRALPALDLTNHAPLLTAIANDKDFSKVFVDQLDLWAQPGDMALALSSSGQSPNVIYALQRARKNGMLTVAFTGKDGGRIVDVAEYNLIVPSFSIHRIQECHVALLHIVWDLIHVALGEEDVL
ncbi:MAG TPA: SIS domain-containing protein [Candidatus Binatia bacterium]|nr:SIS domain-containing protein [Candidatus Binatia bacterium]